MAPIDLWVMILYPIMQTQLLNEIHCKIVIYNKKRENTRHINSATKYFIGLDGICNENDKIMSTLLPYMQTQKTDEASPANPKLAMLSTTNEGVS